MACQLPGSGAGGRAVGQSCVVPAPWHRLAPSWSWREVGRVGQGPKGQAGLQFILSTPAASDQRPAHRVESRGHPGGRPPHEFMLEQFCSALSARGVAGLWHLVCMVCHSSVHPGRPASFRLMARYVRACYGDMVPRMLRVLRESEHRIAMRVLLLAACCESRQAHSSPPASGQRPAAPSASECIGLRTRLQRPLGAAMPCMAAAGLVVGCGARVCGVFERHIFQKGTA